MTDANRRAWTGAVFVAMTLSGALLQMRGAILPTLQGTFGTPEWQLGLVAPAGTVGYALAILATGFGAGYVSPRRLVVFGLLGGGLAVALLGLSPIFAVFVLGIALQGTMDGLLRGINRPLLSHFYPAQRGRVFNYYDMIWAVGAVAGPLLVLVAAATANWRFAFLGIAVIWLALGFVVYRLRDPPASAAEKRIRLGDVPALLRRPEVVAMGAAMTIGAGVEGSLFTWLPIYATQALPETTTVALAGESVSFGLAEVTLSVMLAGYVPGRIVYASVSERIGYARLLTGLTVLLVPVYAVTFLVLERLSILVGIFAVGVLLSGLYPMLVTYATEAVPEHSGPITALAATASALGLGVMPAVVGALIGARGAPAAMALLLVPLLLLVAIVVLARLGEVRAARATRTDRR